MATPTNAPPEYDSLINPTSTTSAPPQIIDDKSPHCIPFILSRLHTYQSSNPSRPFIIGLNGVQGAGKTTLVSALAETLREKEGLETLVLSIDDLYLKREDQVRLAREQEGNLLVQYRGEPGLYFPILILYSRRMKS
jgi:D-glycerate 3-kinase